MAMDFPSSPVLNQQYSNGTTTWAWDGTAWNIIPQAGPMFISDTPPPNPAVGQQWWRSSNGQLYIWYQDQNTSQWVQAAGVANAPGLWEPIGTGFYNLSGAAQYDFPNLSAYTMIRGDGTYTPSASSPLNLRTSRDNGASFDAGATDYAMNVLTATGSTPGTSTVNASVFSLVQGNDATASSSFKFTLINFNQNNVGHILSEGLTTASANLFQAITKGYRGGALARNALRLFVSSGTMTLRMTLEGVRG